MTLKTVGIAMLLGFAAASVVMVFRPTLGGKGGDPSPDPVAWTEAQKIGRPSHQVVAYYFHTSTRCPSCRRIEAWTERALREEFAKPLGDGRLVWKPINTDEAGNGHYVKDFKLFTKSVVISDTARGSQGRWKNLNRVWELLSDEKAFRSYISSEVRVYLGKS